MESNIGKHYLYRYNRLDKNEPFYIGIGTKHSENTYTHKQEYRRAHHLHRRGRYFTNIMNKTDIELEILMESDDYKFIKEKEKEFISLYGLKIEGGSLVNISKGGEGSSGIKKSKEERKKMSKRMKGSGNPQSKKVINVKTGKIYECVEDASKDSKYTYYSLADVLSGKRKNMSNFIYLDNFIKGERPSKEQNKTFKPVIDLETGKIFKTSTQCANYFNVSVTTICNILKGKTAKKTKKRIINIEYYVK